MEAAPSEGNSSRRGSPWRSFLANLTLVMLLFLSALFAGVAVNGERAIEAELHARGEALFNAVVLARAWNAAHGGVLVEKTPGVESSPFDPRGEVRATDGTVYVWKNPALMAKEMSAIAERDGLFRFHITSDKPLNPANAPDAFEARALVAFERGGREAVTRERRGGSTLYRFMAPLYVEASCLLCHASQGYQVGEVRGGVSVTYNVDEAERAIARNRGLAVILFLVTAGALALILWRLVAVLSRRLETAEARIRELAITDDLTGLRNRRYVTQRLAEELKRADRYRQPLACVLFDVDRFKLVNDTHGHDAGDAVLRAISDAATAECRQSDVLGRWGGEEFLLVLPATTAEGARVIAARLREVVERLRVPNRGADLQVTASFGVATALEGEEEILPLLRRADEALYRAKAGGRNRVEMAA